MIKKFLLITIVFVLFVNATSVNISTDKKATVNTTFVTKETKILPVNMDYNIPYLQNNYVAFKEAVAFKESQGKYNVVNTLGYLGKYQFGRTTLQRFKIYNTEAFLQNPEQQEKAFLALCKVNKWILRKDIKRSVGKTINGIEITESGILAAAHLSGAGNVKKFLRSNGSIRFADAYGATIQSYLKKFSNYDVSSISADRKATV
ncbi:peptidoglycan-binding protein LysM [Polaribacter reichenbachii]|uniref:Peptidoglycan-binding protein LysM n=1 Tax=Polaribacter reichenbachii TaxID=996801 RepID=A0A1B8U5T1_9FLAO|nr:peptidoglycan-binding protein LysM [Polaribacter reichenbachii]APZ47834.1 peptidoglycan-binding protein LysM [Polaribacter reichenbachii]AUC18469.1 peptidoglycan-binding protein LysM [Polaribacter reichenbachii]OBY67218.1 peptidoglycan-binding protein LysM [Polaribacter reichenbachii]